MTKGRHHQRPAPARGFLARLARDARGNTLAMMAIALIPISALAGSAVDAARMYVVKVRLQQACDAGVLAGRKFMTDSSATTLDTTATNRANTFFTNNFKTGWMGTTISSAFTPTKTTDNRVAGTVTVTVPMTVMKMFKMPDVSMTATCEARYDVADTDVIFVLDTTGSMACLPSDSEDTCSDYVDAAGNSSYTRPAASSGAPSNYAQTAGYAGTTGYSVPENSKGSRIAALRQAVLDFYDTMAANIQSTTHVRYGFVSYSSSVNAGAAIKAASPGYMIGGSGAGTTWNYESRQNTGDYVASQTDWSTVSLTQTQCVDVRTPTTGYTSSGTASNKDRSWNSTTSNGTTTYHCSERTQTLGPEWTYQQYNLDVSGYVNNASTTDPTEVTGAKSAWLGCIEERDTTAGTTSFSSSSLPADLNPDLLPTTDGTRWRPLWPDAEYERIVDYAYKGKTYLLYTQNSITTDGDDSTHAPNMNSTAKQQGGWVACGKPVQRLATMSRDQVSAYVKATDFVPLGGTYHDTGMIWGVRMLSQVGIFKADNQAWSGRGNPNQVIIFLTDGDMSPSMYSYGFYGMEYWDARVMGGASTPDQKTFHNDRFLAECQKANDMGIDVWTVSIAPSATDELTQCASANTQALYTTSGSDLSDKFKAIAKQVARLRLSK